ncbi:glycosyltransferase family 2 protein [Catenovulum sp. 2E275]|uniref:glycosyltransferase family 2 protein n=1 Tax=Catenovulum sp. 2E275 TaxID=2980497 RepID=UPI0021D091D5|nr:glycosyltransferase family 2 protein [Catenovulum sp. 2E275]MCU4674829.1 glycosyltransferase family 2 protein [Catenovulum sp. 2E275]
MLISVCICTYKRAHIVNTLASINRLNLPPLASLEVIVVDNDSAQFAKELIEQVRIDFKYPLYYLTQNEQNISAARNLCLDKASGEWIALMDDDEVADENWLLNLYSSALQYQADIVCGRVHSTYPAGTEKWIIEGGFFDRKRHANGKVLTSCAANCTLINAAKINGRRFDLSYGRTGGEDAEFFNGLHLSGCKIVYCDDALVSEEVEKNRLNIGYLITRKMRIGATYSKYRFSQQSAAQKCIYVAKNACLAITGLLTTLFCLPLGKAVYYNKYLNFIDKYGKLKFLLTGKVKTMY